MSLIESEFSAGEVGLTYQVDSINGSHDNAPTGLHDERGHMVDEAWFIDSPSRKIVSEAEQVLVAADHEAVDPNDEVYRSIFEAERVVRGVFAQLCEEASKQGRTIDSSKRELHAPLLARVAGVSRDQLASDKTYY